MNGPNGSSDYEDGLLPDGKDFGRGESKDFPVIHLEDAIEIARRVKDLGDSADMASMERILGIKGGALARKLASTRRWGLIEGKGQLKLTNLAKDIFFYVKDDQPAAARIRAFFGIPMFKELYETYSREGALPRDDILRNLVIAKYGLNERDASTVTNIIKRSIATFVPLLRPSALGMGSMPDQPRHLPQQQGQLVANQIGVPAQSAQTDLQIRPVQVEMETKPSPMDRPASLNSMMLYDASRCLGRMEEMARKVEVIRPTKDELLAVLTDAMSVSTSFNRLHYVLQITIEELKSGDIDTMTVLKRLKFFSQSLEEDCNLSKTQ
jgi:hypothetical protein